MDIFIPTIQPRSIVPAFCCNSGVRAVKAIILLQLTNLCNSGVRAVEAITLLQLTNLTIHFRSFHDHHPATIEQPRLSL